ncbi:hypothetical protein D3C81_2008770 [compost metagenome]
MAKPPANSAQLVRRKRALPFSMWLAVSVAVAAAFAGCAGLFIGSSTGAAWARGDERSPSQGAGGVAAGIAPGPQGMPASIGEAVFLVPIYYSTHMICITNR